MADTAVQVGMGTIQAMAVTVALATPMEVMAGLAGLVAPAQALAVMEGPVAVSRRVRSG